MSLTEATLAAHLGILDALDAPEDGLLLGYIDAAWAFCCRYTRRDLDTDFADGVPADLLQAQTMLAAHFFNFREAGTATTISEIPFGVYDLLADFRSFT